MAGAAARPRWVGGWILSVLEALGLRVGSGKVARPQEDVLRGRFYCPCWAPRPRSQPAVRLSLSALRVLFVLGLPTRPPFLFSCEPFWGFVDTACGGLGYIRLQGSRMSGRAPHGPPASPVHPPPRARPRERREAAPILPWAAKASPQGPAPWVGDWGQRGGGKWGGAGGCALPPPLAAFSVSEMLLPELRLSPSASEGCPAGRGSRGAGPGPATAVLSP